MKLNYAWIDVAFLQSNKSRVSNRLIGHTALIAL